MKKNYSDIVDPIHDFIRVYDHELEIIDIDYVDEIIQEINDEEESFVDDLFIII